MGDLQHAQAAFGSRRIHAEVEEHTYIIRVSLHDEKHEDTFQFDADKSGDDLSELISALWWLLDQFERL